MRKMSFAVGLALSLVTAALPCFAWTADAQDLPRFCPVENGIFRGGQPSAAGLEKLKEQGVKTIINLRNGKEEMSQEEAAAKALGFNYVSIPLDGLHKPSQTAVNQFLALAKDPASKPLYVHCMEGVDRTGTLCAIYRQEVDNWTAEHAYKEMCQRGCHQEFVWFGSTVFDYADKKGQIASRPLTLRLYDKFGGMLSFHKPQAAQNN
jgi:protein tyrosine/serine phosphatase